MTVLALGHALQAGAGCGGDEAAPGIPPGISIPGAHRFVVGDDPRFAAPDFDDSDWQRVELPATWRQRTLSPEVFGWHRLRFDLSEIPPGPLAIDLGVIAWSDETFVNGARIGGTGWMDKPPRIGPRARLYPVPVEHLRLGTNVVAIRVRALPFTAAGMFAPHLFLGDALALERARDQARDSTQLAEGLLLGFLAFGWILVAAFPKRGRTGRATRFLLGSITLTVLSMLLISSTPRRLGVSPEVPANWFFVTVAGSAAFYWGFVSVVTRGVVTSLIRRLMYAQLGVAVLLVLWPAALSLLIVAAIAIGLIALGAVTYLLGTAARARTPGALLIAVGYVTAAVAVTSMLILPRPFLFGLPNVYYGIVSANLFAVLALTRHVEAMNRQVQRATEYALEAHRSERGRLARDLHDGLGQMLALLKMQMQRMGRKHGGEPVQATFEASAEQVGSTLDELRRIARDLRPAPMEDRGFGEAVREYAAAMTQRTDLAIEVEGDFADPLPPDVSDELYRITQECLTNCLKHSGARRVVVTLAERGDRCSLVVVDDGRGIPDVRESGLGLETIRERSELLGGRCAIADAAGGGTRVEVSVPRSA